jgi:hypothetical protein
VLVNIDWGLLRVQRRVLAVARARELYLL